MRVNWRKWRWVKRLRAIAWRYGREADKLHEAELELLQKNPDAYETYHEKVRPPNSYN